MKMVTSTKKGWCAALRIRSTQNQVHCQVELNRWPSTASTGSKGHAGGHALALRRFGTT